MRPCIYRTLQIPHDELQPSKQKTRYSVIPVEDGKYMIYVPRKGICSLVNGEFVRQIDSKDGTVRSLMDFIDRAPAITKIRRKTKFFGVSLSLTSDCNLCCRYQNKIAIWFAFLTKNLILIQTRMHFVNLWTNQTEIGM